MLLYCTRLLWKISIVLATCCVTSCSCKHASVMQLVANMYIAQSKLCSVLSSQIDKAAPAGGGAGTPLRHTPLSNITNIQVQLCLLRQQQQLYWLLSAVHSRLTMLSVLPFEHASMYAQLCCSAHFLPYCIARQPCSRAYMFIGKYC